MSTPQPTLAGFYAFIQNVMGIAITPATKAVLSASDPAIGLAYAVAVSLVNTQLNVMSMPTTDSVGAPLPTPVGSSLSVYAWCVYNLAGSNLLTYASDLPGSRYFKTIRKKWNILGFTSGVVQSASDEGTSTSLVVQEAAKNFTLANMRQLKDPYGRTYLEIAQSYGPSTWGIT